MKMKVQNTQISFPVYYRDLDDEESSFTEGNESYVCMSELSNKQVNLMAAVSEKSIEASLTDEEDISIAQLFQKENKKQDKSLSFEVMPFEISTKITVDDSR